MQAMNKVWAAARRRAVTLGCNHRKQPPAEAWGCPEGGRLLGPRQTVGEGSDPSPGFLSGMAPAHRGPARREAVTLAP